MADPNQIFQKGFAAYQAGNLKEAGRCFRKLANAKDPSTADAWHMLGAVLRREGNIKEAIKALRRAVGFKPALMQAKSNLALTLRDDGQIDAAVSVLEQALAQQPDFYEAWFHLGVTFYLDGKLEKSAEILERLTSRQSNNSPAWNHLGLTYVAQRRFGDAEAAYRQAIATDSKSPMPWVNLGLALREQEKEGEEQCYHEALARQPGFPQALHNLAMVYGSRGEKDKALQAYRAALAGGQAVGDTHMQYARAHRYADTSDAHLQQMLAIYPKTKGKFRSILCFALGKAYEDLEDYAVSYRYLKEGNDLFRRQFSYSIQDTEQQLQRIQQLCSGEWAETYAGAGCGDATPIFILGMPRSGTTLVEQILSSHPEVIAGGERQIMGDLLLPDGEGVDTETFPGNVAEMDAVECKVLGERYVAQLREAVGDAFTKYITDKMPNNFRYIGWIRTCLPNAKIIHCVRDPMDVCLSIYKLLFVTGQHFAYNLKELGQYCQLYRQWMAHWEQLFPDDIYTVSYEAMVADQEAESRKLLAACGLEWDDACLRFFESKQQVRTASNLQVRQPIYASSVAKWKCYEPWLGELKSALDQEKMVA